MYRIYLTTGAVLEGDDERDTIELVEAVEDARRSISPPPTDLPTGWVWIAGFYLREEHVAAIEYVSLMSHELDDLLGPVPFGR